MLWTAIATLHLTPLLASKRKVNILTNRDQLENYEIFQSFAAIVYYVLALLLPAARGVLPASPPRSSAPPSMSSSPFWLTLRSPSYGQKGFPKGPILVYGRFDFSELTKRSLGRHWQALDEAEQREFVNALTQKLLVAYGRTVRASGDERLSSKMKLSMATTRTSKPKLSAAVANSRSTTAARHQWPVESLRYGHRERQYREQLSRPV